MKQRQITIPACADHAGYHSLTVTVPWNCIYCGRERGEPFDGLSYDGSRRMAVTCWENPCGHLETYPAVRQWLNFQIEMEAATQ